MVRVKFRISVMVRVRLNVRLTRLTLGVLHAFVREWLASSHLLNRTPDFPCTLWSRLTDSRLAA